MSNFNRLAARRSHQAPFEVTENTRRLKVLLIAFITKFLVDLADGANPHIVVVAVLQCNLGLFANALRVNRALAHQALNLVVF